MTCGNNMLRSIRKLKLCDSSHFHIFKIGSRYLERTAQLEKMLRVQKILLKLQIRSRMYLTLMLMIFPQNPDGHVHNDFHSTHDEHFHNEFHVEDDIEDTPSPGECNSVNMKKRDAEKKISSTKKRSRLDSTLKQPVFSDLMDEFFKAQKESIGVLVDKLDRRDEHPINNKPEVVDKTKLILEALSKIGTLTEKTRLYFAYKIATDDGFIPQFLRRRTNHICEYDVGKEGLVMNFTSCLLDAYVCSKLM